MPKLDRRNFLSIVSAAAITPTTVEAPPPGWFVLDVLRCESYKWDWVALMVDVHPGDLKNCVCPSPLLLWVDPKEHRPGHRTAQRCYVQIPGKHRNGDAARIALKEMMVAQH